MEVVVYRVKDSVYTSLNVKQRHKYYLNKCKVDHSFVNKQLLIQSFSFHTEQIHFLQTVLDTKESSEGVMLQVNKTRRQQL